MGANPTLKTGAATLLALALALTAFATPAAASQAPAEDLEPDKDVSPGEAVTTLNCIQIFIDASAGPAQVTYTCSDGADVSVDDSWEPTDGADFSPKCKQVYFGEFEAGPVTIDASDSCPEVEVDEPTSSNTIPPCAGGDGDIASAGPVTVGIDPYCSIYIEYDKDWGPEGPTSSSIPPCAGIDGDIVSAGPATVGITAYCQVYVQVDKPSSPTGASDAEPKCYDIYYQKEAGPATVTLTSSCSGSVDVDPTWRPSPNDDQSHTEPVQDAKDAVQYVGNSAKCFLTADDGTERFICLFGPPGP